MFRKKDNERSSANAAMPTIIYDQLKEALEEIIIEFSEETIHKKLTV